MNHNDRTVNEYGTPIIFDYSKVEYPQRLHDIDALLDAEHEKCDNLREGSCWCCCVQCSEREDLEDMIGEYYNLAKKAQDDYIIEAATHHVPTDRRLDYCVCGEDWPCSRADQPLREK